MAGCSRALRASFVGMDNSNQFSDRSSGVENQEALISHLLDCMYFKLVRKFNCLPSRQHTHYTP